MQGGTGAFQIATFDEAVLVNARLTGGGASFQLSSFAGADLTGATLTGGGAVVSAARPFRTPNLSAHESQGSGTAFQAVNLDGADFRGADLSTLEAESLKSCYFMTPPKFDGATRFPAGFDPHAEGWSQAPESQCGDAE